MEFYCRQGYVAYLAPEAEKLVRAIESVLALREELAWQPSETSKHEPVAA